MKIAVVCDWLVTYAGAEKVLEQILNIFPEADLFAVVDFLPENQRDFIQKKKLLQLLFNICQKQEKNIEITYHLCQLR